MRRAPTIRARSYAGRATQTIPRQPFSVKPREDLNRIKMGPADEPPRPHLTAPDSTARSVSDLDLPLMTRHKQALDSHGLGLASVRFIWASTCSDCSSESDMPPSICSGSIFMCLILLVTLFWIGTLLVAVMLCRC